MQATLTSAADEHRANASAASKPATADDEASEADRADNHGWFVSGAAKADTPDGFENHGDHVSSIAKDGAGKPEAATAGQERADAPPGRAASAEAKGKPKPTGD